jgi:NAD(P)-dependent dehydrogenase (short-subunit alcohol dehydrogenase family)
MPESLLHNKLVLVTGGTRGLGLAIANALAAQGARVITTSRRSNVRLHPSTQLKPGEIFVANLDVTKEKTVDQLFSWIDRAFKSLDVLINNAGVGVFKPTDQISSAEWHTTIDTNLTGSFLCAQAAFRLMKKQKSGRIINIGSICDHVALPDNIAYAASKYGLRGLTEVLNEDGKGFGIRATLVSPGAVYTEIWHGRKGFKRQDMLEPSDVAEAIVDIARKPARVRIDEIRIVPPKGIL